MDELISRQAAIDAILREYNADDSDFPTDYQQGLSAAKKIIEQLPSAQPERLTDDDFETIRIHLNAYKEKLCNLHRWEEAEEYQRIINRFMSFASAQPEIIRCKDCKYGDTFHKFDEPDMPMKCLGQHYGGTYPDDFCSYAERKTDEQITE